MENMRQFPRYLKNCKKDTGKITALELSFGGSSHIEFILNAYVSTTL